MAVALRSIVVAERAGTVIGFAAFDKVELHAHYVLPECRGQGVGQHLPEAIVV